MRVIHVAKVAGIGGSERHLLTLLPALKSAGLDVEMIVLTAGDGHIFTDSLRDQGISFRALPAGPNLNPRLLMHLPQELRACDLVHTHLIHADLYGQIAAAKARVPAVSSVHSAHGFYARQPYAAAFRTSSRLSKKRIAISRHVASFLVESRLASPDKIEVVHYGIDPQGWKAAPGVREAQREGMGVKAGQIAVGMASRIIAGKGHDLLIRAVAKAMKSVPDVVLLIAGDGPMRAAVEETARDLLSPDSYRFCGYVPDIRGFLRACDLLVFPTTPPLSEGFGLAALEGMAAELPVIATAVGSLPEVVDHGVTGYLVDPSDVSGLAARLEELATRPDVRLDLGRAGRRRAEREFSLDKLVARTIEIYEEVAL